VSTEALSVPDICCDHCRWMIESAPGSLPGVRGAAVIIKTRTVRATYEETAVDAAAIRHTLAEQGYEVAG
jgi:copper chaperone